MKSSFSHPPLWHLSLMGALAMTCSILLFCVPAGAQAQVLIAGFEAEEGFTAGQAVGGNAGWSGGSTNYLIASEHAQAGDQSLRVVKGNTGRLDSPLLHEEGYTGVSLWMSNPDTTFTASSSFTRFRIVLGEASGPQRILQFQFRYTGNAADSTYGLDYYDWTGGASSPKSHYFSQALLNSATWTRFRFEADFDALVYSVWIGNTKVLSDIAIGGTVTSQSSIHQLQFWGHSGTQPGDAYYDSITGTVAVPEPTPVTLLGAALLTGWMLSTRRRKMIA